MNYLQSTVTGKIQRSTIIFLSSSLMLSEGPVIETSIYKRQKDKSPKYIYGQQNDSMVK